jgi:CubicO group peptidase (beta-lactamase class C family)
MTPVRILILLLACLLSTRAQAAADPVFSDTGPDAEEYGAAQGYPVPAVALGLGRDHMVGFYGHYDRIGRMRTVPTAPPPSPLKRAPEELALDYEFYGKKTSLADYLERAPVTGLLIARDDTILFEHYRYGLRDKDRLLSNAMVKTITGLLVGIAVSEGAIKSIDDNAAAYVPELAGTAYGATSIRALLHMSSGVQYKEMYQPGLDNDALGRVLFPSDGQGAIAALRQFDTREAPAGTRWHDSDAETELLGLVVARATGASLSDYLSTRIWRKMGMESDAAWEVDAKGQEIAYCCFVATLRDWARLGLMLAHDGQWNGQQIVPKQWLLDATSIAKEQPGLGHVTAMGLGYGYQVWLMPGDRRVFVFAGLRGQRMFIDSTSKLVLVQTAIFSGDDGRALLEIVALWNTLVGRYGAP